MGKKKYEKCGFVYISFPKEKKQINLAFRSLIRNFAEK